MSESINTAPAADTTPPKLNRKNITSEITLLRPPKVFGEEEPAAPPAPEISGTPDAGQDSINPLVELLDVGLDFGEEALQGMGYPPLMRSAWESRGKAALSKAIDAYAPPGISGAADTPLTALILGLACLLLCFLPVFLKVMQERETETISAAPAADTNHAEPVTTEQLMQENPDGTKVLSTAPPSESTISALERLKAGETP
jgi:hypothetical protein